MREPSLARRVAVIAHRGASALLPEHTLAAYARAIADGADFIEPDLVMTKDGVLVSRHENEISGTTDVAAHAEFASRRTRKRIDGQDIEGWFVEDFTLAELKTLRARARLPELRGSAHDGHFPIATLAEVIELAAAESAAREREVGLIPEIKHGTYFRDIGLPMEDALLDALTAHAYTCHAPVEIQSFEIGNLRALHERLQREARSHIRLLQLIGAPHEQPFDVVAAGGTLNYATMTTLDGLREIATYADAIGPPARALVPLTPDGALAARTTLAHDAHAVGLEVHAWTFRPENAFLPPALRDGDDPGKRNEAGSIAEIRACLAAGMDAFFTDDPCIGRLALGRMRRV